MIQHLRATPLGLVDAPRSFALASFVYNGLRKSDWTSFMRRWVGRSARTPDASPLERGLMGVEDARRCLMAVYGYRVEWRPLGDRVLRASLVAMAGLPGMDVHEAMIDSLLDMSRSRDCSLVLVELDQPRGSTQSRALLESAGFVARGVSLSLPVPLTDHRISG